MKIAIRMDDGTVAIMDFVTRGRGSILPDGAVWDENLPGWWNREPNDRNLFSEISRATVVGPQPLSWRAIKDDSEVPQTREFRDAWVDDGAVISHDMPKARAIHLARLRQKRDLALTALDGPWMRATGQGDKTKADRIDGERQALRDMPQRVAAALEAAQTVEALKQVG